MSNEITLDIRQCKPGMKVSEEIINNFGAILVHKYTILDDYTVNKLMNFGIEKVKVYEDYEPKTKNDMEVNIVYEEKVNEFKTIIKDIGIGKKLDTLKVQNIVRELNDSFTSINEIITNLKSNRAIDEYTYSHSLNVSLLCSLIGNWLGLSPAQKNTILLWTSP